MDVPALRALARAGVERIEQRRQIRHDVFHVDFHAMNECRAARTIPFEAVLHIGRPDLLDDEPDRSGLGPLRRVPQVRRNQQDLALPDRHVARAAVFQHPQHHVAAQLVEEFLVRVVMVVGAGIRPADHLHDQVVGRSEHDPVADRRLEQVRVPVDPVGEIESGQRHVAPGRRFVPEMKA